MYCEANQELININNCAYVSCGIIMIVFDIIHTKPFCHEIFQLSCDIKQITSLFGYHYGQHLVVSWSRERESCGYTNLVSLTRLQIILQGSLATMGYMGLWL